LKEGAMKRQNKSCREGRRKNDEKR